MPMRCAGRNVSIHSTDKGRDRTRYCHSLQPFPVSIHSTDKGRDHTQQQARQSSATFQSTLPTRVETTPSFSFSYPANVSIHSTDKGRDSLSQNNTFLRNVSIHSTDKGRDRNGNGSSPRFGCFNPLYRQG